MFLSADFAKQRQVVSGFFLFVSEQKDANDAQEKIQNSHFGVKLGINHNFGK